MYFLKKQVYVFITTLFLFANIQAETVAILEHEDRFHPVVGYGGMVVSQEQVASRVGAEILRKGGNAIDAAVATGFALAVTMPEAGNLGGGGFMLIHLAEENRTLAIDYRETAPAAAHRDFFINSAGEADTRLSRFSSLASAVPGTVAGLVHAQKRYGRLSLPEVMAPAIELAANGISVTHILALSLQRAEQRLKNHPASAAYFFNKDGTLFQPGTRWKQPDLAATLKRIAKTGGDDFYEGKTAAMIVAEMERSGGAVTLQDLRNYRAVEREAVRGRYRDFEVASMPPPSSGGVHLIQMLNILEGWDLAALGHNSAAYLHRLAETMRVAYADRSEYLGDPDFIEVPTAELMDKNYAQTRRSAIVLERATPSAQVAPGLELVPESPQTTHYSTWDEEGNVVSNTYTLNFSYGNGISVSGAGFLLNNEMDDFSAKVGAANAYGLIGNDANAIAANKRPLSSMTPLILFRDGVPVMVTGSPGGSRIITAVLQMVLNVVDFDMNIAEATAAPRVHHQWLPDVLQVERGISRDTLDILTAMGHKVEFTPWSVGKTQTISRRGPLFYGSTDYRWPGGGAVPVKP